jgi:hypothetical protein
MAEINPIKTSIANNMNRKALDIAVCPLAIFGLSVTITSGSSIFDTITQVDHMHMILEYSNQNVKIDTPVSKNYTKTMTNK